MRSAKDISALNPCDHILAAAAVVLMFPAIKADRAKAVMLRISLSSDANKTADEKAYINGRPKKSIRG